MSPRIRWPHSTALLAAALHTLCFASPSHAQTAQAAWHGYSFQMPLLQTDQGDRILLTTWDDEAILPLADGDPDSGLIVSGEVSPVEPGGLLYRADFYVFDPFNNMSEFGWLEFTLRGADDDDENGIPDALQIEKQGNFFYSASGATDWALGGFLPLVELTNGRVRRTAEFRSGLHDGTYTNTANSSPFDYSLQTFTLAGATGGFEYEPGGDNLQWTLSFRAADGKIHALTGASAYTLVGEDTVEVDRTIFTDASTRQRFVAKPMTLSRSGDRFLGDGELEDGNPETSWPDFTLYRVEVTDFEPVPEPGMGAGSIAALAVIVGLRRRQPRRRG